MIFLIKWTFIFSLNKQKSVGSTESNVLPTQTLF